MGREQLSHQCRLRADHGAVAGRNPYISVRPRPSASGPALSALDGGLGSLAAVGQDG